MANLKGCDVEAGSEIVDWVLEDCCWSWGGCPDGVVDGFAKLKLGNLNGVDGAADEGVEAVAGPMN